MNLFLHKKKYDSFLRAKTLGKDGKLHYVHQRTRSAYFSLKNNLKYLFTWYDYYSVIDIPKKMEGLLVIFVMIKTIFLRILAENWRV